MTAWILAAFLVSSGADSVTTYHAVQRGAHESNPIMASMPLGVALGVKSGFAVGVSVYVAKSEHKKPLLWLLGALSVAQLTIAAHNHGVNR